MEKLYVFAEEGSQLPELLSFAQSIGAEAVDFSISKRIEEETNLKEDPEDLARDLFLISKENQYEIIVLPATKLGREIAPRLAVLLHSGYVEGVVDMQRTAPGITFRRLTLGGTCLESIRVKTTTKIITLQLGRTPVSEMQRITKNEIQIIKGPRKYSKELMEERLHHGTENIQTAERIVAIGRGIKKLEDVEIVETFANALDAKIGVTRPLVEDLKWFPKEKQIGLSGNSIRPKLYIGLGVSGQVQHLVGMKDSKVVVAINKDKTAPILEFADYFVLGDLYKIVPEMTKQLKSNYAG
jgi:electron transfer flavoprotein alpha subunit